VRNFKPRPSKPIESIPQQILKEAVWTPDILEKRNISLPYWEGNPQTVQSVVNNKFENVWKEALVA
jgi:hypothetical protein